LLLVLGGCSREQQDWRAAEGADSIEAYDQFIQRHPDSELVSQARTRVAQLGEDRDWQHAGSADTVDAYRDFLQQHPNGKWSQEARIRIQNFSLSEQSGPVESLTTRAAGGATPGQAAATGVLARPPVAPGSAVAPVSTQQPQPGSAYGIQLGAFSSEAAASTQWNALVARFTTDLQGLHQHVVSANTPSGVVFRLQADVGPETRARSICESLRKQGQGCVAVLPH
jgi:cell division septation protein DedD